LQQRVHLLNIQVISLKRDNEALSQKLNQVPVVDNPLPGMTIENSDLSIEDIVVAMYQVQLKDIQISELHLEIDKLKNVD